MAGQLLLEYRGPIAVLAFYAIGSVMFAIYLRSGRSVVRLSIRGTAFRWPLFRDILKVGALASLVSIQTNLIIAITTALVGLRLLRLSKPRKP